MDKTIELSNRAFALHEELKTLAVSATEHFFRMGEIMKEIRDKKLWEVMGSTSFSAYFSDPELGYKKSGVYHSIKLVEMFPEWKELRDIPINKIIAIAYHVTGENKEEMIRMARGLSEGDLRHQLVVKRIAQLNPRLPELPKIYPCEKCGGVKGVSWDRLCHCGMTPKQIEHISKIIDSVTFGGN